jgi:hypothetical protein
VTGNSLLDFLNSIGFCITQCAGASIGRYLSTGNCTMLSLGGILLHIDLDFTGKSSTVSLSMDGRWP